jgi:RimJ/RimL family protein N-acetyltransferase
MSVHLQQKERVMNKNAVVFRRGPRVTLRPLNKETDLPLMTKWINDPEVTPYLMVWRPMTDADEERYFDSLVGNEHDIVVGIEVRGKLIGSIGLHRINWVDRTATTGTLIGEKKYRGKGYGTEAKMLLLDYAFNRLGLVKINSSVLAFNKRSLAYALKCGYQKEGVRRSEVFRFGKRWDKIMLGVTRRDWLPLWTKFQKKLPKR